MKEWYALYVFLWCYKQTPFNSSRPADAYTSKKTSHQWFIYRFGATPILKQWRLNVQCTLRNIFDSNQNKYHSQNLPHMINHHVVVRYIGFQNVDTRINIITALNCQPHLVAFGLRFCVPKVMLRIWGIRQLLYMLVEAKWRIYASII